MRVKMMRKKRLVSRRGQARRVSLKVGFAPKSERLRMKSGTRL
jgi:hypothetical protein